VGYVVGVDVGTTFSAAATSTGGRAEIASIGTHGAAIPSVVVLAPHGEVLVGEAAERRSASEPTRTAREFKRRLGDPTPLLLGGAPYGSEALMAHVLRFMVEKVAEQQGAKPDLVIMSHPANYGAYKKDLLQETVRLADVGQVKFITEPEAAAVSYASQERINEGEVVAVYDFGGGTFDAAVVRKGPNGFELIGTPEGMERLGGIDFDQAIFAHVDDSLGGLMEDLDADDPQHLAAVARLRDECRKAKEALSVDTDVSIPVLLPNVQTEVRLTRAEFEEMVRPRLNETVAALTRAVRSAHLEMDDVSRILLVGGSSRIPLVGQVVREETGRPVAVDAHPKHAIALGAAQAGAQMLAPATAPPPPVADVTTAVATGTPAAAPGAPKKGSKGPLVAVAIVLAILLAAGAAFALTSGGDDKTASDTTTTEATDTAGGTDTTGSTAPADDDRDSLTVISEGCIAETNNPNLCRCVTTNLPDKVSAEKIDQQAADFREFGTKVELLPEVEAVFVECDN
jgi:molecular chaperone DnaK